MKACYLLFFLSACLLSAQELKNARPPQNEADLRRWLENMVWFHHFSNEEIREATGLSQEKITEALAKFKITAETKPARAAGAPLTVLPYPEGRHPRIGFLEGAVDPQRETKLSVFTPWDETSYVVADVPEAIWSNLGLTYLAHTHVPTIWTKQRIDLPKLEWEGLPRGDYRFERTLPNGIRFGTQAHPARDAVVFKMWLFNGTTNALSDLRVQNCVMLKAAKGFETQTNSNKIFRAPFAVCQSAASNRWIVSAWQPCHRPWGNAPVPCLHSDPKFSDASPGELKVIYGWLSFFEGSEIDPELKRIEQGWNDRMRQAFP
jgi:hypothetical protein